MKKTYIEPVNTVVRLGSERIVCVSTPYSDDTHASTGGTGVTDVTPEEGTVGLGRETISSRDAWEEW